MAKACGTCGGTGKQVQLRSHMVFDRTSKVRCGICAGSGESSYRDDPAFVRWQSKARASYPRHPEFAGWAGDNPDRLAMGVSA